MSISSGALHINHRKIGLASTSKRGIAGVEDAAGSEAVSMEVGGLAVGRRAGFGAWLPSGGVWGCFLPLAHGPALSSVSLLPLCLSKSLEARWGTKDSVHHVRGVGFSSTIFLPVVRPPHLGWV